MKTLGRLLIGIACIWLPIFAQETNNFEIIPESANPDKVQEVVTDIGKDGGKVREKYTSWAQELEGNLGDQLTSWVMTRNTLLDYIVYLVKFLSQIGILIGVVMIIYAGYLYATSIFSGGNMGKGKSAIVNAIIGVLVIAFSYAIMKILTSAFL